VDVSHLNVYALVWVRSLAVTGSLLDQLSPVRQDEGLLGIFCPRFDSVDELSEDDLRYWLAALWQQSATAGSETHCLSTASGQRDPEALMAFSQV
jgi:hypothetical protein